MNRNRVIRGQNPGRGGGERLGFSWQRPSGAGERREVEATVGGDRKWGGEHYANEPPR